jgi:hypothetical protein
MNLDHLERLVDRLLWPSSAASRVAACRLAGHLARRRCPAAWLAGVAGCVERAPRPPHP